MRDAPRDPAAERASSGWPERMEPAERKARGSYYTDSNLAQAIVRRAFEPLLGSRGGAPLDAGRVLALRICDPAMGAGVFLLAALYQLSEALLAVGHPGPLEARRIVAERCLYGVDRDPVAVGLARQALAEALGEPDPAALPFLERNLRHGDALIGAWSERLGPGARSVEDFDRFCARSFWATNARATLQELTDEHAFFHWELAFPEVFGAGGFDAVVGNPPWEVEKPNSHEYFSAFDPGFTRLSRQEALARQQALFKKRPSIREGWEHVLRRHRGFSTFIRDSASYADSWPYHHQGGSEPNAYKLFVEQSHAILREGGQLALLLPSAIYTDRGSAGLRRLLLERSQLRWLLSFENRERVFPIDGRFKFCVLIAEKGGSTESFGAFFMERDLGAIARAEHLCRTQRVERIRRFNPDTLAILEIRREEDHAILEKLRRTGPALGASGPGTWELRYSTEFHMTADSHLFHTREELERKGGFRRDALSRWRDPAGRVALPLYQGRMIDQHDPCAKGWVSGKGRSSIWREIPFNIAARLLEPEFLMLAERCPPPAQPKLLIMEIASATNTRTGIAALVPPFPAGHKTPSIRAARLELLPALGAVFNSLVFDSVLRTCLGGTTLTWHLLASLPLPALDHVDLLVLPSLRLSGAADCMAPTWLALSQDQRVSWRSLWAATPHERVRLRAMLDAAVAALYGLERHEFAWILRDCDHPASAMKDRSFAQSLDPKGFWRVGRALLPEHRGTALALVAFDALCRARENLGELRPALKAFFGSRWEEGLPRPEPGEGWLLPEALCLADHGLGQDDRAREAQPLASCLGPRLWPWQTQEDPDRSWEECRALAREIMGS